MNNYGTAHNQVAFTPSQRLTHSNRGTMIKQAELYTSVRQDGEWGGEHNIKNGVG
jgi:hypothetical protein